MKPYDLELLKKQIVQFLEPYGVERIGIFGSVARGDDRDDSDIDIMVKLNQSERREPIGLKWFTLNQELAKKIGRRVDLVSEDSVSEVLKRIIETDLEVIYEKKR